MSGGQFPSWPAFTEEEIDAVAEVLRSNRVNYWTGDETRIFEREYAAACDAHYGVALGNGTQALEAALRALDLGAGDEVVVTPRTFFASAASIVSVGAKPVFADVDRDSQNLKAETVERVVSPDTKAVIVVHLAGWPCEMDEIVQLADERRLQVIEDCAQAHGARYKGRSVGSIGRIGTWSFCQDKIITTGGEGGMITTDDRSVRDRVWSLKDHGKSWEAVYERDHPPGFRWLHESFGTNWRMLEVQAALGRIQLRRLDDWHRKRSENARFLAEAFAECSGLRIPLPPAYAEHAWYKFYAFVVPEALKATWDRDRIMGEIADAGIPCLSGSCPEVYLERAFDGTGWRPKDRLPVARELGETSMMFPVHPTLRKVDLERIATVVQSVMAQAVA